MDRDFFDSVIGDVYGLAVSVSSVSPVYGGDINESFEIDLSDGRRLFIKTNRAEALDLFTAEKQGVEAIRSTGAISVPEIIGSGVVGGRSYLLMEYIAGASRQSDFWEKFAHSLADMHRADTSGFVGGGRYGFKSDNYIGSGVQINKPNDSWIDFFIESRLKAQISRARNCFTPNDLDRIDMFLARVPELLIEPEQPALVHGDLWSGNFITGSDGYAWLIDPAVYVGHPEVDIAMTELFGGYDARFYAAYKESGLLSAGYEDRREIYNLYHLLNHLNLFGMAQ